MAKHRVKFDFDNLIVQLDVIFNAYDIERVHERVYDTSIGINILCGYLRELAQHAVDTNDEFLLQWCMDMGIVKEIETAEEPVNEQKQK